MGLITTIKYLRQLVVVVVVVVVDVDVDVAHELADIVVFCRRAQHLDVHLLLRAAVALQQLAQLSPSLREPIDAPQSKQIGWIERELVACVGRRRRRGWRRRGSRSLSRSRSRSSFSRAASNGNRNQPTTNKTRRSSSSSSSKTRAVCGSDIASSPSRGN